MTASRKSPVESLAHYRAHLEARHLALTTIADRLQKLRWFIDWLDGRAEQTDLRDLTLADIEAYREHLRNRRRKHNGQPLSLHYQNEQLRHLRAWFTFLHQRGHLLVNPFAGMPPLKSGKRLLRHIISGKDVLRLLGQPDLQQPTGFRDRAILELLYTAGLRGGEACKLTVYDLDLSARTVRVVQGKGKKDRLVPIGRAALDYLAEYLKTVRPLFTPVAKPQAIDRLFLSARGAILKTHHLYIFIKRYAKAAGLPPELVRTHSFRHACATEMLRGGASVRHVQEMLGHSHITTTQLYTQVVPFDLKKVHHKTAPSERRRIVPQPLFNPTGGYRDERNDWRKING